MGKNGSGIVWFQHYSISQQWIGFTACGGLMGSQSVVSSAGVIWETVFSVVLVSVCASLCV